MVKVNVAQYVIQDLLNRFPLNGETIADEDIIDVLIDRWSKNKYVTPNPSIRAIRSKTRNQRYLV